MDKYLKDLISVGENQKLDFKYCVSDSRKIARTLVAFSNSDGGKLLIGVKDNGRISGIKSDEEIYMVDTAVHLFCRPEISYKIKQHSVGTKSILEVEVFKGEKKPYQAKDEDGRWLTYFRHNDQNLIANKVLLLVWKKQKNKTGVTVRFGAAENSLLDYLSKNGSVTLSKFRKITGISSYRAESILANLLIIKTIIMNCSEKGFTYELNPESPINQSQ
ncbi:MAG TPA: ATP-binding protein [Bacteroidales bacterium]|jgi:predicted HTH transcriptional regulator|nr:ATP-binding protein [Bacteroidales bacterium]OQB60603.1 MAG: Divergent AAA domain protein [Bacteroidetes bacterium ADurb.Bin145]HOU02474.1 ATP-binding protein [Bacteroidales bacterium]HQG62999.1 ATP-binding protein [Bacteroidales bacterium]HQK68700.1 ATP-binding protein [Bacteroidales bacterium]